MIIICNGKGIAHIEAGAASTITLDELVDVRARYRAAGLPLVELTVSPRRWDQYLIGPLS